MLNIGLKFAEGFRKAGKECESETENHKQKVFVSGPGGAWKNRVAKCNNEKDKDGKHKCVKSDGNKPWKHADGCDGWCQAPFN